MTKLTYRGISPEEKKKLSQCSEMDLRRAENSEYFNGVILFGQSVRCLRYLVKVQNEVTRGK